MKKLCAPLLANKYFRSLFFMAGLGLLSCYLLFCSGTPYAEPHAIKGTGSIYILVHYVVLSCLTYFFLKLLSNDLIKYLYEISTLLLILPSALSVFFSIMQLVDLSYFPEILTVPICNSIYLVFLYKTIEKNWGYKRRDKGTQDKGTQGSWIPS